MKDFLEKALVYIIPFLLMVSICYNNGYWSPYEINIYDYYQVTDILKAIALPSFNFISLLLIPTIIAIGTLLSFKKPIRVNNKPVFNVNEIKSPIFRYIIKFIGIGYIFGTFIYFVSFISYIFSPYSTDDVFSSMYFESMPDSLQKAIALIILIPILLPVTLTIISRLTNHNIPSFRIMLLSISLLSTFALAYQAGAVDSYKIIAGYKFYYITDKNNIPHKYLGKLDKYFIFLDDNHYLQYQKKINLKIDTIAYKLDISVISEDSLKSMQLHNYNWYRVRPNEFYKSFKVRNPIE